MEVSEFWFRNMRETENVRRIFVGGYTDYHPPRYGSGYDRYIYGHYDGHQVKL